MALSSDFINAVDSHDSIMTRIMLKDSMLVDLTLKEFQERLAYAERKMSDLYDEHDGEVFTSDITAWDQELLDQQMVKVVGNFSRERIVFLKKLVRNVHSQAAEEADRDEFVEKNKDSSFGATQVVGAGLAVGGVAVAAAGVLFSSHPVALGLVGAAAAATGFYIIAKDK